MGVDVEKNRSEFFVSIATTDHRQPFLPVFDRYLLRTIRGRLVSSNLKLDPCRDWLGIAANELDDPRKVLGLSAFESDPLTVLQSAETRLLLLKQVSAGPYEVVRQALIKRVEESQRLLLSEISAMPQQGSAIPVSPAPRSDRLKSSSVASNEKLERVQSSTPKEDNSPFAMPIPPFQSGMAATPPMNSKAPWERSQQEPATNVSPALFDPAPVVRPSPYRRKSNSNAGGLIVVMLGLVTLLLVLGLLVFSQNKDARKSEEIASANTTDAPSISTEEKPRQNSEQTVPVPGAKNSSQDTTEVPEPAPVKPVKKTPPSRGKPDRVPPDAATEEPSEVSLPPEDSQPPSPETTEETDVPIDSDIPEIEMTEITEMTVEESSDGDAADSKPEKVPLPEASTSEEQSAKEHAVILAAILEARGALARLEFETARRVLEVAIKKTDGESAERLNRYLTLTHYAEGFQDHKREALASVISGHEYEVGTQRIGIVEYSDDTLVIRAAGGNKTFKSDAIPSGIVMAIVTTWYDENPANMLFLGAYQLSRPDPKVDEARTCWEKAARGGAEAKDLLPLLDEDFSTGE